MSIYDEMPWRRLYPPGSPLEVTAEYESVLEAFRCLVAEDPTAVVLRYFDGSLTAADLDAHSDALAASLADNGFDPGERVALYLQNVPQYVIALLATWKAGGIAVAANPMLKARELRLILDDSGATVLICMDDLYEAHGREAVAGSSVRRVHTTSALDYQTRLDARLFAGMARPSCVGADDLLKTINRYHGQAARKTELKGDDPAVLTYTSGTTGVPKGAINTHGNIVVGSQTYRDWFLLGSDDVLLGIAPLFHVTGLSGHIGTALVSRMPLVLGYRFDPQVALDMIREHRPTFTVGATTVFVALAHAPGATPEDFASLRVVASGGAPIPPSVVSDFETKTGLYIHNVYGMTETTAPTHAVPLGVRAPVDPTSGALSVGVPVYSCAMWVLDEHGQELPPGEIGELVVAGPRVVPGYWRKPHETAMAFEEGRLHTGDVGFLDEEGWFYLVDRMKDMIIAGGYKVWPRDVEDVLYSHPAVLEAAVVGAPDEYRGETVHAFVTLKAGQDVAPDELIHFCRERMAAYKYPRSVEVVSELPKTASGKILRRELKEATTARTGPMAES